MFTRPGNGLFHFCITWLHGKPENPEIRDHPKSPPPDPRGTDEGQRVEAVEAACRPDGATGDRFFSHGEVERSSILNRSII